MALALAATFATGPAAAGECPAGKTGVNVMKPGPSEPTGVTDTVISAIDIGKIIPGAEGRMLRLRKLVIQPGGVVPWHSHAERPANIYVQEGSIVEYRSTCAAPIVHQAGEATAESGDLSHWWRNESGKPVILISSDILPPQPGMKDQHM
jgi:quercetin dioxygenase-like cupin family protein